MLLIVDDQKDSVASLERLLCYAGHEAVSVTGGGEARVASVLRTEGEAKNLPPRIEPR